MTDRTTRSQTAVQQRRRPAGTAIRGRRHVPIAPIMLGICVLIVGAAAAGIFKVRTVRVIGANLPTSAIVQAAAVTGANIFTVRSDGVINRLSSLHSVVVTRVDTAFPGTVTIYAQARVPAVVWRSGKTLYLVDDTGTVIDQAATRGLPVLTGGSRAPGEGMVAAARYATSTLPAAPGGAISGLTLDANHGLTIDGHAGWKAVVGYGTPQVMVGRVATLDALLRKLATQGKQFAYVDLRYKNPFYRLAGP